MTDTEIFSEMINDSAQVYLQKHYGEKLKVILDEPKEPDSFVEIHNVPESTVVIKADHWPAPKSVFSDTKHECKRADYVMVTEKKDCTLILYIEIKKKKGKAKEITQQLMGAQCFIAYCKTIGQEFWREPDFLKGATHRFISFRYTNIDKKRTTEKKTENVNDKPENFMRVSGRKAIQFRFLADSI